MTRFVEVAVPVPLDRTFFYSVPERFSTRIKTGMRILIPFNRRITTGFIVGRFDQNPAPGIPLKDIQDLLDEAPIFSLGFLDFTKELAAYYFTSWGDILQASLPPALMIKSRIRIHLNPAADSKMAAKNLSAAEKKLLVQLQNRSFSEQYLLGKLKRDNMSVSLPKLEKLGLILRQRELPHKERTKISIPKIVSEQMEMDFSQDRVSKRCADNIAQKIRDQRFAPYLIRGAAEKRGAIFFSLLKQCLAAGRRALFLVPEIGLTTDVVLKHKKRMGGKAALLHSRMPEKQRELEWKRINSGEADIVIGPRSAILTPLDNLGLVIVDEEQDDSYYQAESPVYDARKAAWLRAERENAVVVFGALYPSLENAYRAEIGKYSIPLETMSTPGRVTILDQPHSGKIMQDAVFSRIGISLNRNNPVLVFCPRRGYAAFLRCSRCFYVPKCRHCDIALVYHKDQGKMLCHYCNYAAAYQDLCPQCGGRIALHRGAGSEAVREELVQRFPGKTIVGFDTETKSSKSRRDKIIERFLKGKIDILIGTKMLAHMPELKPVELVVAFAPDHLLAFSDFQASQRVFQDISFVKRLLISDKAAEFVIQTALSEHYSVFAGARGDYAAFYDQELSYRRILNYPPFSCMAEVVFSGTNLRTLAAGARRFASLIKEQGKNVQILGPAIAPIARIRDKKRVQIILKAPDKESLDKVLNAAWHRVRGKKSVRIHE